MNSELNEIEKRPIITVTDKAAYAIKELLNNRNKASFGIRVGIKSGGCSGLSYFIEYADKQDKFDAIVRDKDINILVDRKAMLYLIGTEMDFVEDNFKSGFIFRNPKERVQCGCGKSFNV